MADFTLVDPNSLLPGSPWTSPLAQAAFENPEAIAEGAPDAPRHQPRSIAPGFLIGLTSGGASGFTDIDTNSQVMTQFSWSSGIGAFSPSQITMQVRVSNNNGASWTGWQSLHTSFGGTGTFILNTSTGILIAQGAAFERPVIDGSPVEAIINFSSDIDFSTLGINAFQLRADGSAHSSISTYLGRGEE